MTVRELMDRLATMDPEAVVVFMRFEHEADVVAMAEDGTYHERMWSVGAPWPNSARARMGEVEWRSAVLLWGERPPRRMPAMYWPPMAILDEELHARCWLLRDLAVAMDLPYQAVTQMVAEKLPLTPDLCERLARALGTSAELWRDLEANYRERLARVPGASAKPWYSLEADYREWTRRLGEGET